MFSNKYQVYGYLYTNYWSQCTHRLMSGLETNNLWYLRDYLVATKCAVVWLDPTVSQDASLMTLFMSGMTAVDGVYIGWWPNEGGDLQWIAPYGIPVIASDFFDNATVYGAVTTNISIPVIPPCPWLQNKIYVSITLSDGDNVQYMQHVMYQNWQTSARGKVPIGWTVQPLLADFDPEMLNYYWSTATTNDCLLAGPSAPGTRGLIIGAPGILLLYQGLQLLSAARRHSSGNRLADRLKRHRKYLCHQLPHPAGRG